MCMSMLKPVAFVRKVSRCQHLDCCNLFPFLMELGKVSLWIFFMGQALIQFRMWVFHFKQLEIDKLLSPTTFSFGSDGRIYRI